MSPLLFIAGVVAVVATIGALMYGLVEFGNPLAVPLSYLRSRNEVVILACKLLRDGREWRFDEYGDRGTHPCGLAVHVKYSFDIKLKLDGQSIPLTGTDKLRIRRAALNPRGTMHDQAAVLAARIIERYDTDKVVPLRRSA